MTTENEQQGQGSHRANQLRASFPWISFFLGDQPWWNHHQTTHLGDFLFQAVQGEYRNTLKFPMIWGIGMIEARYCTDDEDLPGGALYIP